MLAAEASGQKKRTQKQSEQLSARIFAVLRHINFPTLAEELDAFLAPLKDGMWGWFLCPHPGVFMQAYSGVKLRGTSARFEHVLSSVLACGLICWLWEMYVGGGLCLPPGVLLHAYSGVLLRGAPARFEHALANVLTLRLYCSL